MQKRHFYISLFMACFLQALLCLPAFAANNPIRNGWYMIQSGNSANRVLDINNWSMKDGGNLETYQKNGTSNQVFYLQYRNNGYYSIRATHSGMYLHKANSGKTDDVHQWSGYGANNTQWALETAGNGYYYIRNRSGNYLNNSGGRTTLGNNVGTSKKVYTASQKWKFIAVNKPSFGGNISNHSALSGSYNKNSSKQISAQLSMNYPVTKLEVVVYNSSGKNMGMTGRCCPNSKTFRFSHTFNFSKLAAGNYYYRIISYNALGDKSVTGKFGFSVKNAAASTLKLSNYTSPGTIDQGSGFTCKGTITSNYKIEKITVGIWNANNNVVSSYSVYPNAFSYDINKIDSYIHFSYAKAGTNYYEVWAKDAKQTKCLLNKAFAVKEAQLVSTSEINSAASRYGIGNGTNAYKALQSINSKYYSKLSSNKTGTNIFLFEGVGNDAGTGKHANAMCVVVKNGKIVFINKNCTTIPDKPFNSTSHPTLQSGVYSFVTIRHHPSGGVSNYAALKIKTLSGGDVPVLRFSNSSLFSRATSPSINVHARWTYTLSNNSEGCQMIGAPGFSTKNPKTYPSEYLAFCKAVGILNNNKSSMTYTTNYDNAVSGRIVIDRSYARNYLLNVGYPSNALSYLQ